MVLFKNTQIFTILASTGITSPPTYLLHASLSMVQLILEEGNKYSLMLMRPPDAKIPLRDGVGAMLCAKGNPLDKAEKW